MVYTLLHTLWEAIEMNNLIAYCYAYYNLSQESNSKNFIIALF
jgi:hypothetical protein